MKPVSVFRSSFGDDYGVTITDGPLTGLLSRAVVVINAAGNVVYTEQVPEIAQEPDYDSAWRRYFLMGFRFNNLKKRPTEGRCPITQIEFSKPIKALSKRERQIRYYFHSIRIVAFIHLLIAIGIPLNKAIIKAQILLIILNLLIALLSTASPS